MPTLRIDSCEAADLPIVQRLAEVIWRQHYPGIITVAQIDYMLARGYSAVALSSLLATPNAGIAIARADGEPVGFVAWHPASEPATMKLDKLYVLPGRHGQGIGRKLIEHAEQAGRDAGCRTLVLNVNKHNTNSIAAYERCGFVKQKAVVVDIGGGFVMDDFVLAKPLA